MENEDRLYDLYALDEDIKILENMVKSNGILEGGFQDFERKALEHLIEAYRKVKEEIQRKENIIKHLGNSNAKYYEDNVRLLRKNGHIDILSDNLHYKYWDDVKNYIPKSKIREKVEKLEKQAEEVKNHYRGTYACLDEYLNAKSKIQGYKELLEEE